MTDHRQNTKRRIIKALIASGLISDLRRWMKMRRFEVRSKTAQQELEQEIGRKLRHLLESFGPTYIKLGQVLSTRRDILPPAMIRELEGLQDQIAPLPFEDIRGVLERQFDHDPGDVFFDIDPQPLASASIAQVHLARLEDGSRVCLKVRRPGIRQTIAFDLRVMEDLLDRWRDRLPFSDILDYKGMMAEFRKQLKQELDFLNEAKNLQKFIRLNRDDQYVRAPRPYTEYSTEEVLVLEYIEAASLRTICDDYDQELRSEIAKKLIYSYANQVFRDGYYHADPHPGNILIEDARNLIFLDFGIVSSLSVKDKYAILLIFLGVTKDSPRMVIDALYQLNLFDAQSSHISLEYDLQKLLDAYLSLTLKEIDINILIDDFFSLLLKYRIRLPGSLTMFFKTLAILEGVIESFNLQENILELAQPIATKLSRNFVSKDYFTEFIIPTVYDFYAFNRDLPKQLNDFTRKLRERDYRLGSLLEFGPRDRESYRQRSRLWSASLLLAFSSAFLFSLMILAVLFEGVMEKPAWKLMALVIGLIEVGLILLYIRLWRKPED